MLVQIVKIKIKIIKKKAGNLEIKIIKKAGNLEIKIIKNEKA